MKCNRPAYQERDRIMKKFKLVEPGTDHDILGEITEANPYASYYGAELPGEKLAKDLNVGEGCLREYRMGGHGVYKLVRVQ